MVNQYKIRTIFFVICLKIELKQVYSFHIFKVKLVGTYVLISLGNILNLEHSLEIIYVDNAQLNKTIMHIHAHTIVHFLM